MSCLVLVWQYIGGGADCSSTYIGLPVVQGIIEAESEDTCDLHLHPLEHSDTVSLKFPCKQNSNNKNSITTWFMVIFLVPMVSIFE